MDFKSNLKFNLSKGILFSILIIIGAHLPLVFLGGDSFIITDDNLNGEFLLSHLLKISGNIFNINQNEILYNIGGGIALKYFHSPFSPFRLLFIFFDSFDAYIINSIIVRIIAFFGMYFLINTHFKKSELLTILISLSFAFVPAYSSYGLTVFGQPFLLWSFLNLEKSIRTKISIGVIIIFSVYSVFALVTPFILFLILAYFFYKWIKTKKFNKNLLFSVIIFFIVSILANIHIISTVFLTGDEQTFRLSRQIIDLPSLKGIIYNFIKTLSFGDTTVNLFISIPILILIIISFYNKKANNKILILFLIILFNTLIYSLYPIISAVLGKYFSFLSAFSIGRFIFLNTLIFYLIFILLTSVFNKKIIFYSLICIISFNYLRSMDFYYNSVAKILPDKYIHIVFEEDKFIKSLLPKGSFNNPPHEYHQSGFYSYNEFYSLGLFKEIDEYIGIPKNEYKIVNLGIHPSVSQYNGFYTLDGYIVNYPIRLFKNFQKINKKEIEKTGVNYSNVTIDNTLRIISSDLEKLCGMYCFKKYNLEPVDINLDFNELKKLNVDYLFSTVELSNIEELGIKFERRFDDSNSPYVIHLYKL